MRRPIGAAAAAVVLLVVLLVPAGLALAADDSSYAGTYKGVGNGKNKKGKKGSSGATVWVEDLGDTMRFTFRFDKLPVVVDIDAPEKLAKGGAYANVTIKKMGVNGRASLILQQKGQTWMLLGKGSGKAGKYEGTGSLVCTRVSTGVEVPSLGTQFMDLIKSLGGGTPDSSKSTTGGGGGGKGATPAPEVTVKPVSSLAPAKPKPPVPVDTMLQVTGAVLIATGISAGVGLASGKGL